MNNAKQSAKCSGCGADILRKPFDGHGKRIENFFCSTKCKADWQQQQKPVDREWLYQKYIVEGLTTSDIAKIVGRNSKRVWEWLKGYGIKTNPRGAYKAVHFKKGHSIRLGATLSDESKQKIREARLRDGRVPYLKNGVHHLKGKKGADTPNWRGGVTPARQGFYSTEAWKDACKVVWRRADAKCERCGLDHRRIDRESEKFHVHHIVSFMVKELRSEPSNLVLLCSKCHRFVHSKKNVNNEFIKRVAV